MFAGVSLLLVSPHAGAQEPIEKPSNDENAIVSSTPAQDDSKDLSKSLANPIAALNIIPFQFDYNDGLGVDGNGQSWSVDIQPVVPFAINDASAARSHPATRSGRQYRHRVSRGRDAGSQDRQ